AGPARCPQARPDRSGSARPPGAGPPRPPTPATRRTAHSFRSYLLGAVLELHRAAAARNHALRPEDHDHDDDDAEHQEAPLEQVLTEHLDAAQPLRYVGDQHAAQ